MKEAEVLQMITDIDAALIEEASTFTRKKKKWKVFLTVAASVLLIAGAFSGIFYNNNKVKLDSNGKIDVYSMKGAQILNENGMPAAGCTVEEEPLLPDKYIPLLKSWIKSGWAVVYGTAKNIKAVTIEEVVDNNNIVWNIVTFDIDIMDDLQTLDGRETIHVVSASLCENGCPAMELNTQMNEMLSNPEGLFILRNSTIESTFELRNSWKIKGKEYKVADFADYFAYRRYECDGESFRYGYGPVPLDDLRIQNEEREEEKQ